MDTELSLEEFCKYENLDMNLESTRDQYNVYISNADMFASIASEDRNWGGSRSGSGRKKSHPTKMVRVSESYAKQIKELDTILRSPDMVYGSGEINLKYRHHSTGKRMILKIKTEVE
ncbi:MAG: hypothetical protein HAW67_03120 [Endozoicomonadaceae bacterium]|nr:hypothetical protein [Endozoicomonadaceae bacterium]